MNRLPHSGTEGLLCKKKCFFTQAEQVLVVPTHTPLIFTVTSSMLVATKKKHIFGVLVPAASSNSRSNC